GGEQIAALSEDGVLHVLDRNGNDAASSVAVLQTSQFRGGLPPANESNSAERAGIRPPLNGRDDYYNTTPAQVKARVSVSGFDDLVVLDSANRQLHIFSHSAEDTKSPTKVGTLTPGARVPTSVGSLTTLDVEGEPAAVLPMRLNMDAFSDLVILKRGGESPLATSMTI